MSGRPLLLDLFCGAGGAALGYHAAGFDVIGVDIDPQPFYPFEFRQYDALDPSLTFDRDFVAVHASPPCQAFTTMSNRARGDWPNLIPGTRDLVRRLGLPYVIENVPGASRELVDPIKLHGGMFGARYARPRLFEVNFPVDVPVAAPAVDPIGFYGRPDGRRLATRKDGSIQRAWRWEERGLLGMGHVSDRAAWHDVAEAIPPAYTEFIGRALLAHLGLEAPESEEV
jgi:DNA (cytosine-5)-methyltransferase 1